MKQIGRTKAGSLRFRVGKRTITLRDSGGGYRVYEGLKTLGKIYQVGGRKWYAVRNEPRGSWESTDVFTREQAIRFILKSR